MKIKNNILCILCLFVAISPLRAVVVSTVGELETAIDNANSGGDKEIVLANGTYMLTDMLPIWEDGVTVRSQSGNRNNVKIYGEGMTGGVTHIFNVAGTDFTARDLTIGRVANHAIQIWGNNNSSNTLLSNLHIVDTNEQMVKISYDSSSSNRSENGVMQNCLLEYTAGVGPQWYIGGIDGHQTRNWTVRNNVFKYISSPSGDVAEHAVHFWSDSIGTVVENNQIIDCDRGIGFGLGSRGHSGGIIRNNFIYHSTTDYGFADVGIGLENASSAKVYNNTIYMANGYSNAVEYRFSGTSGGIIKNNLCNKSITSRDGGSADVSTNITNAQAAWFENLSSGDLHLASQVAQVVDQGVTISGLSFDYDGDSRPQGAGIDIGADEYVTAVTEQGIIALSRGELVFGGITTGTVTGAQTFSISNDGEGTLDWSISDDAGWLSSTPASGTGPAMVSVSVDVSGLSAGTYPGTVTVSASNATNSPRTVAVTLNVYAPGGDAEPFGSFDSPLNGSTIRSSVAVTGWALDDVGIDNVKIYRDAVSGEGSGMVYIGDAILVEGARVDIEPLYPDYPMNYKAGWGYMMLTNFLPNNGNGTFILYAVATDVSGNQVTLGSKTVYVDNAAAVKPFGAIDTPVPGGTASGNDYRNMGWVLTPLPNEIPDDGSTITVYLDGIALGHPTYNIYRSDISAYFPGYANSGGAAGYFDFDTTAYADGVHTIAWSATDNAGNTDGIGSRYFNIENAGNRRGNPAWLPGPVWLPGPGIDPGINPVRLRGSGGPVGVITGYERDVEARRVFPGENGIIAVEVNELARIEIRLDPESPVFSVPLTPTSLNPALLPVAPEVQWTGRRMVHGQLRRLPIGSTLDVERGVFYWQPGPGFTGDYYLNFFAIEETGRIKKTVVKINIIPAFGKR